MRAVISVIGKDTVGILAKVSAVCAANKLNIVEVTQSVLQDFFAMIMVVDISAATAPFAQLSDDFAAIGDEMGLSVRIMHEDIFNSMHTI
jgi:ACT domain-containing protein